MPKAETTVVANIAKALGIAQSKLDVTVNADATMATVVTQTDAFKVELVGDKVIVPEGKSKAKKADAEAAPQA